MCAFGPISSGRPAMDDGDDDCYDYDGHDHWPYCTRSLVFILILGVCTRAILLSSSLSLEEMFNILFSPIFLVSGQARTLVRQWRRWPHSIKSQTINTTIDTLTMASTRPSRARPRSHGGGDYGPFDCVCLFAVILVADDDHDRGHSLCGWAVCDNCTLDPWLPPPPLVFITIFHPAKQQREYTPNYMFPFVVCFLLSRERPLDKFFSLFGGGKRVYVLIV